MTTLTTDRLVLRRMAPGDYAGWKPFMLDARSEFVRDKPDVATAWRGFCHVLGHWEMRGWGLFALTRRGDDRAIGSVGPWYPENWTEKEIGWTLWSAEHEGNGYVTEAAEVARRWVYDELGWTTAVSYIAPENARSIAVAKRLGATLDEAAEHHFDDPCVVYRHPAPEALR
ncbi:MAG: GNAT family N-acetyltransferase [Pseudomonadota bacterium]